MIYRTTDAYWRYGNICGCDCGDTVSIFQYKSSVNGNGHIDVDGALSNGYSIVLCAIVHPFTAGNRWLLQID